LASSEEFARRDVEYRLFFTDPIFLIAPCDHPWAEREEVTVDELREADLIMREEGSGTFDVVQQGLRGLGVEVSDMNAILTLGNSEAIALAVQEGLGLGFVSRFVVQRLVQGGVHPLRVRDMSLHQEVYIAQSRRHQATKAQSAFWKFVTSPRNPVLHALTENELHEMALADMFS
jgi:DNA-binding transcriptional LysR family regulator